MSENQNPVKEQEFNPTCGGQLVGVQFNPSKNPAVDRVKDIFAGIIDGIDANYAEKYPDGKGSYNGNIIRGMAVQSCLLAQMAVVKFLTWND